jgi:hypothetical protein
MWNCQVEDHTKDYAKKNPPISTLIFHYLKYQLDIDETLPQFIKEKKHPYIKWHNIFQIEAGNFEAYYLGFLLFTK